MSNVKAGDLAIIVACFNERGRSHIGKVVQVLRPSRDWPGAWETAPVLRSPIDNVQLHWNDDHLKPIRDPGDDAVDQSLTWLPSPSREKEAA